jgi:hypothetical protein
VVNFNSNCRIADVRLEDQAFDRAHRLGQKLDVNIYKLTVSGTVEDRRSRPHDWSRRMNKLMFRDPRASGYEKRACQSGAVRRRSQELQQAQYERVTW